MQRNPHSYQIATGYRTFYSLSLIYQPITKKRLFFLKKAAYVPYRALIAEDFPNLLVAGRCISADKTSFASLRVQASCMGVGQAAGVAAAQCIKAGVTVQKADIHNLIEELKKLGAII